MASNKPASVVQNKNKNKSIQHCCVPLCTSDSRYNPEIHFHHFPKNPGIWKQWIAKIRRDPGPSFKVSGSTVVCSKHFKKEDYRSFTPVRKVLLPAAIPSIFDWSSEQQPRRKLHRKILSSSLPSSSPSSSEIRVEGEVQLASEVEMETSDIEDEKDKKITELEEKLKQKTDECEKLQQQLKLEKFGLNRFTYDDSMISFYSGFDTYKSFIEFFNCIQPNAQNMQSAYYQSSDTISLAGRKRSMLLVDEFFMFLCRLRAGLLEQDLSVRFNCSLATVSRKIITWTNFLYFVLGSIPIWLTKDTIQELMPDCFKKSYPNTRVIIDCTEIRTQQPSSLVLGSQLYSNYKGTCTFKGLLGIAPHGAITFISSLYTGCISDNEITKMSGLLDLLEPGDDVMADKGFTIAKLLKERDVTLNIPPFLSKKQRFSKTEVHQTEEIAKLRIHVERMNKRIKENHLFDTPIPLAYAGSINQLWTVACLLGNFKGPLVYAWSQSTKSIKS